MTLPKLVPHTTHWRLLVVSDPVGFAACFGLAALQAAAATAVMITTGRLVGSITSSVHPDPHRGAAGDVWYWLAATVASFIVGPVAASLSTAAASRVGARYLSNVYGMILETASTPPGLSHIEGPRVSRCCDELAGESPAGVMAKQPRSSGRRQEGSWRRSPMTKSPRAASKWAVRR